VAQARCPWARNELAIDYHDNEWGVPLHDERRWFEFVVLEGAQAGLSWDTILVKRDAYRTAFHGFDPQRVARYTQRDVKRLLGNAGIVRNRLKIEAAIHNARSFLDVVDEFGSFDSYAWGFVGGKPRINRYRRMADVPAATPESEAFSKDLRKRRFRFVGPVICYALMQATGMVNDHLTSCPRWRELGGRPRN
jgi:DNA-3-methyladenine glycosylase I